MIRRKFEFTPCCQKPLLYFISMVIELAFHITRGCLAILKALPGNFSAEKIDRQIVGRISGPDSLAGIEEKLKKENTEELIFFCSSAGEYEQALPVIASLARLCDARPLILFQSRSGIDYARKKGEPNPCALAPPDVLWRWYKFTAHRKIKATFVIRHEWWPSFLYHFSKIGPLYLIDAAVPARNPFSRHRNRGRAWLARFFTKIFTIDEKSTQFFSETLQIDNNKIQQTGDTKFDRVMDRAQAAFLTNDMRQKIERHVRNRKIIVAGSIYQEDIEFLARTFEENPALCQTWSVVAVPHHIDPTTVKKLYDRLTNLGDTFIVIPELGVLAELYSIADVAWIGGACHNKVHNVLEAAAHGAVLACGVNFTNSREAVAMNQSGLLYATNSPSEFSTWLAQRLANSHDNLKNQTLVFVHTRIGSATTIAQIVADQTLRT